MGPSGKNRLAGEVSPYLLQHAGNPVGWYPWGPEALRKARQEDRPIFLSIGYAACHWCHVMERESFQSLEVAALLDGSFVPIKVDREERPDIDAVYMAAVQAMTGSGGWPLSVFLTPGLEPIFGGTYFPPKPRWGRPSFLEVLRAVSRAWQERREEIDNHASSLASQLSRWQARGDTAPVDLAVTTEQALTRLHESHDPRWGGFGPAPKFPTPSRLFFLLRRCNSGDERARHMLTTTLDGMASGGMYDWIGGGFHRYAVDQRWLIPHFEKMLYDNALLARAYGAAAIALNRESWREVARATSEYLLREMQGSEGGFFSSTDADSQGEEGLFFTWTAPEVTAALTTEHADLMQRLCSLQDPPNFEHGRTVLRPSLTISELAGQLGRGEDETRDAIFRAREQLREARSRRPSPASDDKRLAGWNGMAIWALAHLSTTLQEPALLDSAQRCAQFILAEMIGPDGRLVRSWRAGRGSGVETLEDVAWVSAGLVELFQNDGDQRWLSKALLVCDSRLPHYLDSDGRLLETSDDGEELPLRPRNPLDGATPAPSAVLAATLLRLATLTDREDLRHHAEAAIAADSGILTSFPENATTLLDAAADLATGLTTVVIVGATEWPSTRALLAIAHRFRQQGCLVVHAPPPPVAKELVALVPLLEGRTEVTAERAKAYVCRGSACELPTGDADELAAMLLAR